MFPNEILYTNSFSDSRETESCKHTKTTNEPGKKNFEYFSSFLKKKNKTTERVIAKSDSKNKSAEQSLSSKQSFLKLSHQLFIFVAFRSNNFVEDRVSHYQPLIISGKNGIRLPTYGTDQLEYLRDTKFKPWEMFVISIHECPSRLRRRRKILHSPRICHREYVYQSNVVKIKQA